MRQQHRRMDGMMFTAADRRRIRQMERLLLERGFLRDEHGFWFDPATRPIIEKIRKADDAADSGQHQGSHQR
jgi:hypothetical protein